MAEARLEQTEHGLVPQGEGWFVLNARDAPWIDRKGRGVYCEFEGEPGFPQVGINLQALGPGEPMAMYHWEADDEDFLVLAGDAVWCARARSGRCGRGTSFTARPARST